MLRRLVLWLLPVLGCTGIVGDSSPLSTEAAEAVGVSGLRRLTRVELDATLRDLVGEPNPLARTLLPPDPTDPFDNDYRQQLASTTLVDSLEALAQQAAERTVADMSRKGRVLPCMPTGANDATCYRLFVRTFGRQALRRPLTDDEVERFMPLHALGVEANSFDTAVTLALRAFLQHPEFVYRVELGVRLGPGRRAAHRLSPRDATLVSHRRFHAARLAARRCCLGSALHARRGFALRRRSCSPTRAPARRWSAFTRSGSATTACPTPRSSPPPCRPRATPSSTASSSTRTPTTSRSSLRPTPSSTRPSRSTTASPSPARSPTWTAYGATPRKGLLSHGSVLSQGVKFADSSPTQRGIFIRNRLLCQEVPPPPPGVNVDEQPTSSSPCKKDRYQAHASAGGCKGCHSTIDPIGFGLERFDRQGRYRTTDDNLPQCAIEGSGTVDGTTFNGPTGLADALIASGRFEECITTQLFRYAAGRREEVRDHAFIARMTKEFIANDRKFLELLVELVSDDGFAFRRDEEAL
jgi:hypothetical protein